MRRWWILALCLVVGCAPATVAPVGSSAPSPAPSAVPGSVAPTTAPSAVSPPSPTAPASGPTTVTGRVLFNNRPCCERAYKTPLVGTTITITVLYCPSVPDLVGTEYTVRTDLDGKFLISGLPRDTSIKLRIMSYVPVERQITVGSSPDDVDFVVDGPPCTMSIICPTTIRGTVLDTFGHPLDGVTITASIVTTAVLGDRRFDGNSSDTVVTATVAGAFTIDGAPTGATIRISASKPGYLTRQKTIIPVSLQEGPATANDLSFGKDVKTGALDPDSALAAEPASASPSPP